MRKYAIIGFGCAGYHGAKTVRDYNPDAFIDVYSDHGQAPYNPMLTTYYASGRLPMEGMFPFGTLDEITRRLSLQVYTDMPVLRVDGRTVVTAASQTAYDGVLISTGAVAFVPPITGLDSVSADRVFCMRTSRDAERLKAAVGAGGHRTAVVVGASMVGIKVVELLNQAGIRTTLADMAPYLFPLAAYPEFGALIGRRVADQGVELLFGAGLERITNGNGGLTVHLGNGMPREADILVLCIGTRAAASIVDREQVRVNRGILVNQRMETSCPGVYAAGDCCESINLQSHENQIIGLWANAAQQGITAGANMAGGHSIYYGNILHNITHFMGMDFIGFGDNRIQGTEIRFGSPSDQLYIKAVIKDHKLAGVNILDNYRISGVIKNYFIRLLEGKTDTISPLQRGILQKEGLSARFIDELEGKLS